ncbi:hypothetical protein GX50_08299 [[Emmonsia] crescens]|uniref:Protein kinase domain-containing protein n=1 Tax=[Emmonsia] crescens TaxID=73230 RepID=A0A2B7Z6W0_9EURO|nr:hypothetical protein GX50_08299 [Emmonsia crescens]
MKAVVDAESLLYINNRSKDSGIVDFGKSSVGRTPFPEEEERYLPGVEISPLLRWNQAWGFWHAFDEWIDWDWQAWLEDTYAGTRSSITDHMRSIWLPSIVTEPPPPLPNIE